MTINTLKAPPERAAQSEYYIESLARGLAVLRAFTQDSHTLGVSELARRLGFTKTTVLRILNTLQVLGYVRVDPVSRRYQLSWRVLELGYAALENMELPQRAHPYLQELAKRTDETVNLAVLDGTDMVYLDRIHTHQVLNVRLHIGSRVPAYCTSMGKALLAYIPEEQARAVVRNTEMLPRTRGTLVTEEALMEELARTRARGFAVNDEELLEGIRSVAAPLRDRSGSAVAAINLSVPAARVSLNDLFSRFAPEVVATANEVSAMLGYDPQRELAPTRPKVIPMPVRG